MTAKHHHNQRFNEYIASIFFKYYKEQHDFNLENKVRCRVVSNFA